MEYYLVPKMMLQPFSTTLVGRPILMNGCLINLCTVYQQTLIQVEPEELVVNTALLQLAGYPPPSQPYHPPCIQALPEHDRQAYDVIVRCMEHLAVYLKYCGNGKFIFYIHINAFQRRGFDLRSGRLVPMSFFLEFLH